jgi:tetratricopeptide (TPR) repeat protein
MGAPLWGPTPISPLKSETRKACFVSSPNQRFLKISYRGADYRWSPTTGFTLSSGMSAPAALRPLLEAQIEATLNLEDAAITDPAELAERAEQARKLKQLSRSEKLAGRAVELAPEDPGVAAVLGAVLCDRNQPQKAIAVTKPFADFDHVAILQVRAAALSDLRRLDQARAAYRRAIELLAESGERPSPELIDLADKLDKS